jgi:hypothetical protein
MPGFTGVGAGEWRLPSPAPPAGAVGGFYLSTEDNGGYHRRGDGTWSLFSSPFGVTTSPYDWIDTIAVAGDDAETVYAFTVGLSSCHVSHDGGATWASHPLSFAGVGHNYRGACSPQSGHVYVQIDDGTSANIYKSTDDGVTWASVVNVAAIGDRWGGCPLGRRSSGLRPGTSPVACRGSTSATSTGRASSASARRRPTTSRTPSSRC